MGMNTFYQNLRYIEMICILILFIPGAEEAFIFVLLASQFVTELGWLIGIGGCAFYSLNHWKKSAAAN